MKTRCRNYGGTRRMTAGVLHPSRQDSTDKDTEKAADLKDDIVDKEPQVLHETRAQKQAFKNGLQDDHAETIKDTSCAVVSETINSPVGVATRSSTRPTKRLKLSSPQANKSGNQENKGENNVGHETATSSPPQPTNRRKKKVKRQWESWGKEEKDTFFEAVHEYGKDFDRIRNFIATKHKRRGDPPALIKNKDQVRHFYYRTLNKIAKYLPADKQNESDNHKKMVVELRGLICYGELRKKICGWHDKHGKKLHDLVSHGTTTIRYNGRNSKIKAPVCRALKRLASVGQDKEEKDPQHVAMPNKLVLELLPHSYVASAAVQRLAKNPRLRTTVPAKKPLSLMLDFLKQKWRVMSKKTCEPLDMCIVVPLDYYADSEMIDNQIDSPASKNSPGAAGEENTPSAEVEACPEVSSSVNVVIEKSQAENGSGSKSLESTVPLEVRDNDNASVVQVQSTSNGKTNNQSDERVGERSAEDALQPSDEVAMDLSSVPEPVGQDDKIDLCAENSQPEFWTSETCGTLTFGDIFCKLGRPPKLKLEYTWQDADSHGSPSQTAVSLKKLVDIAVVEFSKGKAGSEFVKPASKATDVSLAKSGTRMTSKDRTTSSATKERPAPSVAKEKTVSKVTRVLPKTVEKLSFILPSVVPPAAQTSTSKPVFSDLPPQTRPFVRVRKRSRTAIQRTLLPRPVGGPSSVPPGAVAVSFIPQPGQTVGTILASGASTSSLTSSAQSAAVSSPTAASDDAEIHLVPSPDVASKTVTTRANSDHIGLDMASFPETDLLDVNCFQVDPLVDTSKTLTDKDLATPSSVDSIIGLALGTALDVNGANTPIVVMNEDSGSDILVSMAGSNLDIPSQPITGINSNSALATSEVHIEELNYGVAGGVPSSVSSPTSPTLDSILNPSGATVQSPVSTSCDVFFSSTGPISSDSHAQQKESESVPSLMLSPSTDSELHSSFPSFRSSSLGPDPQWLNGEVSNFSLGSLLDKLTTSPRKELKEAILGDSASASSLRESSQDSLLHPHHLLDADTAFRAMMDENSVDYVKKFEDLAKEMAGDNTKAVTSAASNLTFSTVVSMETNSRSSSDEGCSDNLNFRSILRQNNMNAS